MSAVSIAATWLVLSAAMPAVVIELTCAVLKATTWSVLKADMPAVVNAMT